MDMATPTPGGAYDAGQQRPEIAAALAVLEQVETNAPTLAAKSREDIADYLQHMAQVVRVLLVTCAAAHHEIAGLKLSLAVADELLQQRAAARPN